MATKKMELTGTIEKVTRMNEKSEAQMVVLIPVSVSSTVPVGKVHITIEPIQSSLLEDEEEEEGGGKKKAVRGDRG